MKKAFLIISITAFSFASAQQQNPFDIQNYLKKRVYLRKKIDIDNFFDEHVQHCEGRNMDYIFAPKRKLELELPGTRTIERIIAKAK